MTIAERNRLLKKVLTAHFGKGKVRVRGDRGTAYGWVDVKIDVAPTSIEHRRELQAQVWKLIKANKIDIGTYGYDDPGSDYGYGSKILISFNDVARDEHGEVIRWEKDRPLLTAADVHAAYPFRNHITPSR